MKLEFVEVAGFRGFRERTRFDFSAGFAVLTGRNGVGKSSLFDAIDFALTGTITKYQVKGAKGGGLDSHIWWIGSEACAEQYVRVGFADSEGNRLWLRRSRDQGLESSEENISQRFCAPGVVPVDWAQMLIQTSLIRDELIAAFSLDLTEQARFSAVQAAMGGLQGPDHSERTKAIVKAAESLVEQQRTKVVSTQSDLGRTLGTLTEAQSAASAQEDIAKANELTTAVLGRTIPINAEGMRELRGLIVERRRSVEPLLSIAANLERIETELGLVSSEEAREELELVQVRRQTSSTEVARDQDSVRDLEGSLRSEELENSLAVHFAALLEHGEAIGLVDGHCPLCSAIQSNEDFRDALSTLRERLSERGRRIQSISTRLTEARRRLVETQAELDTLNREYEVAAGRQELLLKERTQLRAQVMQWGVTSSDIDTKALRELILRRQEGTSTLEQAIAVFESSNAADRIATIQGRISTIRSNINAETGRLHALEQGLEIARQIDRASRVIANELLTEQFETVLPLLKELYMRLRPHSEWQEIETDIGGHVRASLNFTVGDGKNPQFLFSSGQRRTAGLAFLLAIHLSRPWCKFQTLLLDDPVQHIDDYRALNLVEVLSAIRRTDRQIIIAVEDPALADVLCRRLRSTIAEEGKRFEMALGVDGAARIESETVIAPLPDAIMQFADAS